MERLVYNGTGAALPIVGEGALYVNLYLPSEVTWKSSGERIRLSLETEYPESETVSMRLAMEPAVYAQQILHKLLVHPPKDEEALNDWFLPTDRPGVFQFRGQVEASQRDDFKPFYAFEEMERYRLYTDPSLRSDLW